jgi:hypothetical protein
MKAHIQYDAAPSEERKQSGYVCEKLLRRVIEPGDVKYCGTAEYLPHPTPVLCVKGNTPVMLQPPVSVVTIQLIFEGRHNRITIRW